MAARKFLYFIAAAVMLVLAGAVAYRLFGDQLLRAAMTPSGDFASTVQSPAPDYALPSAWLARPARMSAALFAPAGFRAAPRPAAAAFFVAPTAYVGRDRWSIDLADATTTATNASYLRAQASALNGVAAIWAPSYRQAGFGAFLTRGPDATRAIDFAYADVARAWDAFLAANPAGPIILAGHSQGSLHLIRLIAERIAGRPVARRIVAVYLPGWPVSVEADLPALGLPACAAPDQPGCILSWMSFAEPAEPSALRAAFDAGAGSERRARRGTRMLCTNPMRGFATEAAAVAAANLGALRPAADATAAPDLIPRAVGARCAQGILLIGPPPEGFDRFILPGNNYHVYDWHLYWANLRADAERRLNAWIAANPG